MDFKSELSVRSAYFESYLRKFCEKKTEEIPSRLKESMNYSLLAGGKRLRPVLCMAGCELAGEDPRRVMPMALAFEMVHTASLIHDDLPCMDNDTLRRGKPTNHVRFGESLALLAGDALFLYSFETALEGLTELKTSPERILEAMKLFSACLGPSGICGGQVLDTDEKSRAAENCFVKNIAAMKTMVLIRAAVATGAVLGGMKGTDLEKVMKWGECTGIAFQIADDILDVVSTSGEMGKTIGKDAEQDKLTFVSAYGLEEAEKHLKALTAEAVESLESFGSAADFLKNTALYLARRSH